MPFGRWPANWKWARCLRSILPARVLPLLPRQLRCGLAWPRRRSVWQQCGLPLDLNYARRREANGGLGRGNPKASETFVESPQGSVFELCWY